VRIDGRYTVAPAGDSRFVVMRQPVGPCLLITPWNFPTAMGARKIAPAIAAGCTMVVKPAQQTPLSMLMLARILKEAGLPDGVLNVIPTSNAAETVTPLLADMRLRKVSFTGSTAVGRTIAAQAAPNVLRVSLELGGNAPFLVFDDADIRSAVKGAMIAKYRNIGQACTAANRFHVAEPVAAEFCERLASRTRALTVGRGTDPDTRIGPLIDQRGRSKVTDLVDDAVARGARVVVGGKAIDGPGYFYQPTVLSDVPAGARLLKEEVFGPVAPITTFTTEAEAISAANDTEFGLVAYMYTRDHTRAMRVMESLQVGMVGVNQGMVSNPAAPFGGVKQSGVGREGGREGIDEYLQVKYAAMAT
jgi:succinate-semialdehyde dehydrogenase/glutarate-semialdehyde dehydrogenase